MDNENRVYQICLQAFTEVFAITSHELKNCLAIINENSGLLDDLIMISGETIESSRVQTAAESTQKQVNRSDIILKTMNRFAHTADRLVCASPVAEILSDIVKLTDRKAAGVELTVTVNCDEAYSITGELPVIEALIYNTLSVSYSSEQAGKKQLSLLVSQTEDQTRIAFQPDNYSFVISEEKKAIIETLCSYLNAEAVEENNNFVLVLKSLPNL